jgi:hypothetical protein
MLAATSTVAAGRVIGTTTSNYPRQIRRQVTIEMGKSKAKKVQVVCWLCVLFCTRNNINSKTRCPSEAQETPTQTKEKDGVRENKEQLLRNHLSSD